VHNIDKRSPPIPLSQGTRPVALTAVQHARTQHGLDSLEGDLLLVGSMRGTLSTKGTLTRTL
jgi:hypothetical protein